MDGSVKTLAAQPNDWSSIPRTPGHVEGRELTPLGYPLTSTHAVACTCIHTHRKGASARSEGIQGRVLVLLAKGKGPQKPKQVQGVLTHIKVA